MEADDSQVTTVFIVQPSFRYRPSANPSIMKRYHRRRTCSHTSPRRSPTMVTLHVTRFVECLWWNDGWTVKNCRHLTVVVLHDTGPRFQPLQVLLRICKGGHHLRSHTTVCFARDGLPCVCVVAPAVNWD